MDGYSGFGAPMTRGGLKITMPCPAPRVVVFDLDVAAAAPGPMAASGYGDLSAKIPAGADWILADATGVDPIHPLAWKLVQGGVQEALSRPADLAAGIPEAYEGLCNGLIMSGLAMQVAGGTRPASGAEHYFSHLWELDHLGAELDPPLSHGFKVAIGTLAMAAFYEKFLARNIGATDLDAVVSRWPSWDQVESDIRTTMSGTLIDKGIAETKEKYVDAEGLRRRLTPIVSNWPVLKERMARQIISVPRAAGYARPSRYAHAARDIGLTPAAVKETFPRAMYYRSRYTVLDVARELGIFNELVDEVFAPGGIWELTRGFELEFRGKPVKVIAIDIDGSYAPGLDLSDFGYEVLRRVEEEGVSVVVVTGRCESAALTIAERAGAHGPAISCTGAVITEPGTRKRVALNPLPRTGP